MKYKFNKKTKEVKNHYDKTIIFRKNIMIMMCFKMCMKKIQIYVIY